MNFLSKYKLFSSFSRFSHYNDVTISTMVFKITRNSTLSTTVCQSSMTTSKSMLLVFCYRGPVDPPRWNIHIWYINYHISAHALFCIKQEYASSRFHCKHMSNVATCWHWKLRLLWCQFCRQCGHRMLPLYTQWICYKALLTPVTIKVSVWRFSCINRLDVTLYLSQRQRVTVWDSILTPMVKWPPVKIL